MAGGAFRSTKNSGLKFRKFRVANREVFSENLRIGCTSPGGSSFPKVFLLDQIVPFSFRAKFWSNKKRPSTVAKFSVYRVILVLLIPPYRKRWRLVHLPIVLSEQEP